MNPFYFVITVPVSPKSDSFALSSDVNIAFP